MTSTELGYLTATGLYLRWSQSFADLETVVDYLKLDRMILNGAASSGPIAIAYAAKYPERVTHLILYGTFAYYGKFVKEEIKSSLVSLISQPNNWLGGRALVSLVGTQIDTKYLESLVGHMNHVITPEMAGHQLEMAYKLDVTHLCPLVKAPTLVMHRKGDKYIDFKAGLELASLIPNARFVPLEGNIHFNFLGDTESYLT